MRMAENPGEEKRKIFLDREGGICKGSVTSAKVSKHKMFKYKQDGKECRFILTFMFII